MAQLSASAVRTLRAQSSSKGASHGVSSVTAVPAPRPVVVPPPAPAPPAPEKTHDLDVIGPRKLIRPTLPEHMLRRQRLQHHDESPLVSHASAAHVPAPHESSHAESFYFQKQVQTQTPMVFVLEDGDRIEGCIEWYDRNAIKVRCQRSGGNRPESASRVLIYKSSIKYLYKAGENAPQF